MLHISDYDFQTVLAARNSAMENCYTGSFQEKLMQN